jgi:hypothetical protein
MFYSAASALVLVMMALAATAVGKPVGKARFLSAAQMGLALCMIAIPMASTPLPKAAVLIVAILCVASQTALLQSHHRTIATEGST